MVFIPYGSYTATAAARALIPVACEHCGCMFGYIASRQAKGTGRSLLWLDNEGAAERAREAAVKSLDSLLKKVSDLVPCLRCVKYQSRMVRAARRRFVFNGIRAGGAAGLVWFVGNLLTWDSQTFWQNGTSGVLLIFAAVAGLAVLAGAVWAVRFDPDAHAQQHMPPKSDYSELTRDQFRQISVAGYVVVR